MFLLDARYNATIELNVTVAR